MTATVTNDYLRKEFENFEKADDLGNLLEELQHSTLIVPMDDTMEGFAMIEINDEIYIPLFTDIHEYQKVSFSPNFHPEVFDFNFYLELLYRDINGFVVNVESERFPITKEFREFMDTDYRFDLDYRPFTAKEIKEIYDSIDNSQLREFLNDESNREDFDSLMNLLLKSDLLSVVVSKDNLGDYQENGVISYRCHGKISYMVTMDNCAVLFSSKDKISINIEEYNTYSILVNLGLFIDSVLKRDLAGIRLDDDIVISRDYLIDFMKGFTGPSLDSYDDYAFEIE